MDLEEMPWFPQVATSSVTEGESAPNGFTAKVLHVRWDSIPMLIPDGNLDSEEWWSNQSGNWGEWPTLMNTKEPWCFYVQTQAHTQLEQI